VLFCGQRFRKGDKRSNPVVRFGFNNGRVYLEGAPSGVIAVDFSTDRSQVEPAVCPGSTLSAKGHQPKPAPVRNPRLAFGAYGDARRTAGFSR